MGTNSPSGIEKTDGRILRIGTGLSARSHTGSIQSRSAYVTCAPNYRRTVDRCCDRCVPNP
jgi:hypothetical protein